jgi:ribosome assembly protein RRB1
MSNLKRQRPADTNGNASLKAGDRPEASLAAANPELEFEDEYEDEYESENEEIFEAGVDGRPDEEREAEEGAMDIDQDTFIPGRNALMVGETLSPDTSTYDMLHTVGSTWPCLSIDIVPDQLGNDRLTYPHTIYAVAGTQAEAGKERENQLMIIKLSGLGKMEHLDSEEEEEEESDGEEYSDPILETKAIPLNCTTNRIRMHQAAQAQSAIAPTTIVASMLESGTVLIHDVSPHLTAFDTPGTLLTPANEKPLCTIRAHKSVEGFALGWSPLHNEGRLATGDHDGKIFLTTRTAGGGFVTDTTPYTGHVGSVEELEWSPAEKNVFASAGVDGTVKIWDTRSKTRKPAISVKASATDVNVLSWSALTPHLLASGADDGQWAVWDLRSWKPLSNSASAQQTPEPVAAFDFHKEQITSVEFHPTDDSIVMVAAADNTVSLWDLAVELDDEESRYTAGVADVPPQLLFVHYMENVKGGHWHKQIPGTVLATGAGGFGYVLVFFSLEYTNSLCSVFKTISV